MDPFVNEKDFERLTQDKETFAVLDRILRGDCDLIRTNHENLILCHSAARFPVWIWTPDGCPDTVKEKAWNLAAEYRPLSDGYRFNMKYELADYFMKKAEQNGRKAGVHMQLFAYDCPSPAVPYHPADGSLYRCTPDDTEEVADLIALFYKEIGENPPSQEYCVEKAQEHIGKNEFFFWKDAAGRTVACCSYRINQKLASLASVFTLPERRRKYYAQHLVYEVTKLVSDMGYMPMLYTDANYIASNTCYEKIGYILRGKLCTVSAG